MQQYSSPKIIEITISTEMLGRYASYKIQVDQIIISRRFNDFVHFYDALHTNYPGLPEKQAMGNLGEDFLQVRRRMLQHFLNSIFKRKILWNSPETKQLFNKQNQAWIPINNESLSLQEKYKQNLHNCSNIQITLDMKLKVKPMIENFKKMCNNYVTAKTNLNTKKQIFVNYVLPELEKNLLFKSDKKFFEKIKPLDLMKQQRYLNFNLIYILWRMIQSLIQFNLNILGNGRIRSYNKRIKLDNLNQIYYKLQILEKYSNETILWIKRQRDFKIAELN